jgi:hypothetical protein
MYFVFHVVSPRHVLQRQNYATDQEKEKLNPYENKHQSVNVLSDINFQVAKVSFITWKPLFLFCI